MVPMMPKRYDFLSELKQSGMVSMMNMAYAFSEFCKMTVPLNAGFPGLSHSSNYIYNIHIYAAPDINK